MDFQYKMLDWPCGKLSITVDATHIVALDLRPSQQQETSHANNNALLNEACQQIECYLNDANYQFQLPIKILGTDFQKCVWRALQKIPPGKPMSYGELAKKLQTSPRAIGQACRTNRIPLIIPCHRIISQTGLGGFAGDKQTANSKNLQIKQWLLSHEHDMA